MTTQIQTFSSIDPLLGGSKKTKMCVQIETYLKARAKRSEKTFESYKTDIEQFVNGVFKKPLSEVTKSDMDSLTYEIVDNFFNEMFEEEKMNDPDVKAYKNISINRKISSLSSLLKNLHARDYIECNIKFLDLIETLPDDTESIAHMPIEVVKEFLHQAQFEKHKNEEKQALIILAVDSALRTEELLSLTSLSFTKVDNKIVIKGRGKGKQQFAVAINETTYERVMRLLKNPTGKLFTLSKKNIRDMMKRIQGQLGYDEIKYSFHSLRKNAITFTYEAAGLLEAQKKAHHKSSDTTKIYIKDYDLIVTGSFSMESDMTKDLYKDSSEDVLREAIATMSEETQLVLNSRINDIMKQKEEK